ncbi:MAG: hypothetical protein JW811_07345, partial [Clostridiales bacterium]|nr:hypothetical protein [Clostridiales bacterium]
MKFTQSGLRPFVRPIILALALIFSAPCLYTVSAAEYVQGISAGDQILFGYYEQDNDQSNGMESIPWEVLVVEGDRALLISQSNLDCKAFNPEEGSYTWETCALRNWLNSEFLNTAFTEEEREIVRTTAVKNDDNPKYGTNGGGDTQDRIFLLSIAEAQDYFKDDDARRTKNTAYAKAQGAYEEEGFGGWWLRSPGDRESTAATVIGTGSVRRGGRGAHKADRAVRPALWVNIQQLLDLVDAQEFEKSAFSANEAPAAPSTSVLQSGIETKANESEVIWSNVNFHTVQNGAKACYVFFELEQATVVTFIRTCHYLSGGAMPGKLMLYAETGLQWGPFQAIGADGQGDVKNAYWVVDIGGIELPAGRYAVEDSSPETWSSNEESGFEGFLEVFGYAQTADFLGNPFITVGMDPVETTSLLTENDSLASETAGLTQKFAPGDLIAFGHYEQDNDMTNGAEAIYWRVLDLDENKALLISVYNLDCGKYHEQLEAVTWESATLRTWLNSDFLNNAFTEQEQELIMTTVISNEDNSIFGTDGGPDTQDRVFLLSLAEVEEYFYDDDDRHALGTPYAQAQGAVGWDGYGSWWLRSPGKDSDKASYMSNLFCAMSAGNDVDLTNAIRPALYIKLGAESSFGDRENTTMTGIETATLDETPVSVESNPVETTTLLTENNGLASETAVPKQGPSVGELVLFGQYEQDNDNGNGMEYITWRVLDSDENKALLISVYNLDCGKYHEQFEAVTWENATLRSWLNNDFLNTAFTQQEQESIVTATISNEDSFLFGTDGGLDTQDQVFLLSLTEVEEYFCDDDDRRALNTPYVRAQVQGINDN